MRAALLGPLLLAACGPKLDPLLPMRSELAQARQKGPVEQPHLRFAIAESTALTLVEQAARLDKPRVIPLGMGAAVSLTVDLDQPDLTVTKGPYGPRVDLGIHGTFDASVSSILGNGKLADGLGFNATLGGTLAFKLQNDGDDQLVMLRPVKRDPWKANVRLAQEKGMLTNKLVNKQLGNLLDGVFAQPTRLGRIPATVPLRALALRLLVADTPTAGVWLAARPTSMAPPVTAPKKGWALSTTDEAILLGARAALVRYKQHKTWQIEPRELTVEPTSFEAVIRLHKVARSLKFRDYRVKGAISLSDELTVKATSVEEIDKKGFSMSLIGPFVKGRVKKEIMKIDLTFPASTDQQVGKEGGLTWTLTRLRKTDAGLVVNGSVTPKAQPK